MTQRTRIARIALIALFLCLLAVPAAVFAETSVPPDEIARLASNRRPGAPRACPDPASLPRPVAPADKVTLPILMYHHITHLSPHATATWRNLTVTPEALEAQVQYLADHGYHTIYFTDLAAYFQDAVPLPDHPIILTFDDGWIDDYTVTFPILKAYCMVGTFFPPVDWVNNGKGKQIISWPMIEEMSRGGMEFGSHTLNHHLLNKQNEKQIMQQLVDSKAEMEKHTVRPVVVLAYPGGGYNALAVSLVPKAGYSAAVSVAAGSEQARSDLFLLHRITIPYSDDLKMFETRIKAKGPAGPSPSNETKVPAPKHPESLHWPDRWWGASER